MPPNFYVRSNYSHTTPGMSGIAAFSDVLVTCSTQQGGNLHEHCCSDKHNVDACTATSNSLCNMVLAVLVELQTFGVIMPVTHVRQWVSQPLLPNVLHSQSV